jgi:hypothetical protein
LPFEPISKQQMSRALIYFDALTKVETALANASMLPNKLGKMQKDLIEKTHF